jgi:hypothetical protein
MSNSTLAAVNSEESPMLGTAGRHALLLYLEPVSRQDHLFSRAGL